MPVKAPVRLVAVAGALLAASGALAAFSLEDNGTAVSIREGELPVLTYNYGVINAPAEVDPRYGRSGYIHPLWGLDGEVLSQDFPKDHPHHRGVFWSWPQCKIGDREIDPWDLRGARQVFSRWMVQDAQKNRAYLEVENAWILDYQAEPFVRERLQITAWPADERGRFLDFAITLTNVSSQLFSLRGRGETGYGGFNYRPDAARPDKQITAATGLLKEDALLVPSPWADYSARDPQSGAFAGVALFQHPRNPDYPHPGWILRHYGFLGASWPQYEEYTLQPGESVTLQYRIFVHRGTAEKAEVAQVFERWAESAR